jgi:hypothetical protein
MWLPMKPAPPTTRTREKPVNFSITPFAFPFLGKRDIMITVQLNFETLVSSWFSARVRKVVRCQLIAARS